ncbi:MAG: efflux RND transporter permease subunit [Synechococcaceae cyanobacterium]|nr:efflux RND transporter permease subunit [Synechococcaceae cyanobacterium]
MSASNSFILRPVLTTVCSLLIVIAGLIALPLLPIENLPDIAPPTVKVVSRYTGADALSVEEGVTTVLEQQINGVENMEFITSTSAADGTSAITVSFASGTDGAINQVNVQNRVALAEPQLPAEVRQSGVTVSKASNSILLVYNISSTDAADPYSVETLSGLLDQGLTDQLRRVRGVGEVTYFGNRKLAIRLWLDPVRLTQANLTAADVVAALQSQNRLVPAGQVGGAPAPDGQTYTFTVQLQGRLLRNEEFENLVLRNTGDGGLVRLRDVGRVSLGGETYDINATDLRGVPSVGLAIYQLSGSNALEVSEGVAEVLREFQASLPPGVQLEKIYDVTDFISASIQGVTNSLRDAVVLVVLILFLFLQDWKATLVPAIAIPVALVGTFAFVKAFGFSLNQLTLFGLVLATGLVVDDAITVIEGTASRRAEGLSALQAAKATMDELFAAVLATSLVLFAVFLPVLFFPGATGTIYKQFAATIIFAIVISTFNALTFSPMLSALLLAREGPQPSRRTTALAGLLLTGLYGLLVVLSDGRNPLLVLLFAGIGTAAGWSMPTLFRLFNAAYGRAERGYAAGLNWVLSHRRLVMGGLAGGIALTAVAFQTIPGGFVPVEDQGYGFIIVQTPDGGSAQTTAALNRKVAAMLQEEPSIAAAAVFSGAGFDGNAPNRGLAFFGTRNWSERQGADQGMEAIVERLNRRFAGLREGRVIAIQPPSIPGYGNAGGFEFQMLDRSGGALDLPGFFGAANRLIQQANAEPGLERVFTQFSPEAPQLRISVDRARLQSLGINFAQAMQVLSFNFGGAYVNDTFQEGKVRRVYVQADAPFRATPQRLEELYVPDASGRPVPLAEFITISPVTGPTVIPHFNLFRSIKVEGLPAQGFSSGQAISTMGRVFERLGINGISSDWSGLSREEVKAGALAIVIFALGILVVYLVLAGQYESISDPLIILMTVPTAMLGALVFLGLRGEVLNIYAQVGLVMLIGLAAKNGILIVDLANQRLAEGLSALEAAREAARSRLRPIVMTAISSLFGFLPLVLASGAGARSQTSLGTVVFGGLLVATLLSLFVVPVFYVVMKGWLGEGRGAGTPLEGRP